MVETRRDSTAKSGAILIVIALAIVAACVAVAAYLYSNPDVLSDLMVTVSLALLIIFAVVAAAYAVYLIVAVFYYASKGEITQTDISYNLDDVKPVRESSSEDEDE